MSIAHTNVVAKIAAVAAGLALVLSSVAVAVPARAATTAELEAQVAALLAQLQAMQGGTTTGAAFTMDMTIGASGAEVTRLQNWLISKGHTIAAGATGYFGAQTAAAVAAYQTASGITPAAGYFGPMTRAKVNASLTTGGTTTPGNDDDDNDDNGDLEGGAGEISSADFLSGLNNEEVGEDDEDVEVAGLEIEAGDDSDIEITSVRLVFNEGGSQPAGSDFEDYASEVSVWFDGEEVARLDGSDFEEDNDWTRSVSLDDGAIVRAGETGELTVAISAVGNVDSADVGDTWTVEFDNVRFMDGDGATVTEDEIGDIGTVTRTFSFTTFAAAADTELELSATNGDEADMINDAHVIEIDANDDTDGVAILAFNLDVEGDSDLTVDELPVTVITVGADAEELVTEIRLMLDGEEVDSQTFSTAATTTTQVIFDDMDLTLDADSENEFTVEVDLQSQSDTNVDNGDTIRATISELQLEAADIEDESGEDLGTSDQSGSASSEASALYDAGIMVTFVSATESKTNSDTTGVNETVEFTLKFDVEAFGDDVYVDKTCAFDDDGTYVATQTSVSLDGDDDGSSTSCTDYDSTGDEGTNGFLVEEDQTETFTVSILGNGGEAGSAGTSVTFTARVNAIGYKVGSDAAGDTVYTFNLDEVESDAVTVFDR